jgi:5'-nucleotidase
LKQKLKVDKSSSKMERRDFLKSGILSFAGASLLPGELFAAPKRKKIIILHTNDIHSRLEPYPNDGGRNANQGGMTKLSTIVGLIRREEENILLLDAGDIFQGTPYFNFYGGELELKLMSSMGFNASTLGNHEFDNGLRGIYDQLPHADFPFLVSNYDFSKTILKEAFQPYKTFNKAGIKVGVFGLGIQLEGLVGKKNFEQTKYLDPVSTARETVSELRSKKCDLIICLSHLGYSYKSEKIDDLKLAGQVDGIDLIIGGHTHTFLDSPTRVKSKGGYETLINQVGTGALRLGMIEFEFKGKNKVKNVFAKNIAVK